MRKLRSLTGFRHSPRAGNALALRSELLSGALPGHFMLLSKSTNA